MQKETAMVDGKRHGAPGDPRTLSPGAPKKHQSQHLILLRPFSWRSWNTLEVCLLFKGCCRRAQNWTFLPVGMKTGSGFLEASKTKMFVQTT